MLTRTTSANFPRCTTSLTLRVRGVGTRIKPKPTFIEVKPRLPLELVETIVTFMLSDHFSPEAKFFAIRPFSRASRSFREISLRLYFRDMVIDTRALFTRVWSYLAGQNLAFGGSDSFGWVRSLVVPSHIITGSDKTIGSFSKLENLDICFAIEGLTTQGPVVQRLIEAFTHSSGRTSLKKLILSEIPCIDAQLLLSLSITFPCLKTLAVETTRRIDYDCCVTCLGDSLTQTRHSPIPDYYPDAERLADSFAKSLAPMTKLENLYFGLYLSDAVLLEEHADHADESGGGRGAIKRFPLCAVCGTAREETRRRERLVSLTLSKALPSLMTICWDTLFNPLESEGSRATDYDKEGFYFSNEDDDIKSPVFFAATFAIHRHSGTGEVRDISIALT